MDNKSKVVDKAFIGRTRLRIRFWDCLANIGAGSIVMSFYGTGGVGKSTLLKRLAEEIRNLNKRTHDKCIYVKYDFGEEGASKDMRVILTELKNQLSKFGCSEFQSFDWGNYFYSTKIGQKVDPPEKKSLMDKFPRLKKLGSVTAKSNTVYRTAISILSMVAVLPGVPIFIRLFFLLPQIISSVSNIYELYVWIRKKFSKDLDDERKKIFDRIIALSQEENPNALYDYLPTLFAIDVKDWMKKTGNKLVIILDNYESLIGATSLITAEHHKKDMWIHGAGGLFSMLPDNTLWLIAGRNKLHWNGAVADKLEQYKLKALSRRDTARYLKRSGVANKNLRNDLFDLTKGYPYYLDLCVELYRNYKRQHDNAEPTIDEFGRKREEVIGRIFRYLDKAGDDTAKDMLEFLCVLNVWTDEMVENIGGRVLNNFSHNTYERVKGFSLVEAKRIKIKDTALTHFRFEKKIQSFIFTKCDKKLIAGVKTAVDEYFKKFFAGKKTFDVKEIFYLRLWANFIVRFAADAEKLRTKYAETIGKAVNALTNSEDFEPAEEILNLFMYKIENFSGTTDNAAYAYFERRLSALRLEQGNCNAAYELAKSSYEKRVHFLGEKHPATVSALNTLANALHGLGRHEEELVWREKVLALRKEILVDKSPKIVDAMDNLAAALGKLNRHEEALDLQEKVLALRKENFGDEHRKTLDAMGNLAITLSNLDRHEEALKLREQVFDLRKKFSGTRHRKTLNAMNDLAISYSFFARYDEALELREQLLTLYKKKFTDKHHPKILDAMNLLAMTYNDLDRHEKALDLQKEVFDARSKLGEVTKILSAMQNLAATLNMCGRQEEKLVWQKKIFDLLKNEYGDNHSKTIDAMNDLANTLTNLNRHDEALDFRKKVLTLRKKVFGDEAPETLMAAESLAGTLNILGHYGEASELTESALPLFQKIFGEDSPDTLKIAAERIHALNELGRNEEAVNLQRDILARCEKTSEADSNDAATCEANLKEFLANGNDREQVLTLN